MSDVSGIPYMGPMGMGNFFAPQFSYNPQINPTAGYAGPSAYGQDVLGGILQNTQRSQQHTADLITSAAMAMPSSPGGAYMFSDTGGPAGGWGGNAFNQGAINNFVLGGGGYNFPSIPDYSGGLGGGGGQQQPINWGSLFGQSVGGMSMPQQSSPFDFSAGNFGAGMFGGLAGGMGGAYQGQNNPMDWSRLFGGGGARTDPYPNMSMPGGLNAPMTLPQQQPLDYGSLFGRGAGGMGGAPQPSPYTSGIAPDQTGGQTLDAPMEGAPSSTADWSTLFSDSGGMAMPGGLNSPMTMQEPAYDYGSLFGKGTEGAPQPEGTRTYDFAPMFEGGGGGGLGTGGADTSQLFGAKEGSLGGNAFDYNPAELSGAQDIFPQSAEALAEQARARLAGLMDSPETAGGPTGRTAESAREAGGAVPPAARPAEPTYDLRGRQDALATLRQELQSRDLVMTSSYRAPTHPLSEAYPGSAHTQGRAFDTRARTPEQADRAIGQIRELLGARGLVEGRDYRIIDEVRHPSRHATGPHVHTQLTEQGMQQYQRQVYQDANPPRPPADIPFPQGIPTPVERPAEAPARPIEMSAVPLEQRPGVNQGQDVSPPPADIPPPGLVGGGFNALDAAANAPVAAAPVKHTGLELARANIDTPIEKIAMERGGQKAVDQISSMAMGMTPRQLQQSYGGLFMSRAEPLFKSLGITRQDFEQALKMSPTKQDLKMRFGEGFGGMGGELPSAGAFSPYPDFRQSADFENRTAEQLDRGQLAALQARGTSYEPGPEAAFTPLGSALGLGDLPIPQGVMPDMQSLLGYTPQQWPDAAYPQQPAADDGGNTFAPFLPPAADSGGGVPIDFGSLFGRGVGGGPERFPYDAYSDVMPSNLTPADKAIARNRNPGAQYPGSIADMYQSTGQESLLGGKYKIATFDTPIEGAAANFENLSRNYVGMTIKDAMTKWSGGLRSVPGPGGRPYDPNMVITLDMVRDPSFAIPFLKAISRGEAPGNFPMSERDWQKAHGRFTGDYPQRTTE